MYEVPRIGKCKEIESRIDFYIVKVEGHTLTIHSKKELKEGEIIDFGLYVGVVFHNVLARVDKDMNNSMYEIVLIAPTNFLVRDLDRLSESIEND